MIAFSGSFGRRTLLRRFASTRDGHPHCDHEHPGWETRDFSRSLR